MCTPCYVPIVALRCTHSTPKTVAGNLHSKAQLNLVLNLVLIRVVALLQGWGAPSDARAVEQYASSRLDSSGGRGARSWSGHYQGCGWSFGVFSDTQAKESLQV